VTRIKATMLKLVLGLRSFGECVELADPKATTGV